MSQRLSHWYVRRDTTDYMRSLLKPVEPLADCFNFRQAPFSASVGMLRLIEIGSIVGRTTPTEPHVKRVLVE